jgi:hypothetical protein
MPETLADSYQWESDEGDWESDEALAGESDESVEDIGERARETRRSRYRPTQGVQGIRVRRPDGVAQTVRFPAKLPTTAEVNRGLASQEMGRRALEEKLARLEKGLGRQVKNDAAISGLVTLAIGGGLTAYGAVKAAESDANKLKAWTNGGSTQMAALISATQLATTGARLVTNGRYHRSQLGMAADIFSVAQLATFVYGTFSSSGVASAIAFNKAAHTYTALLDGLGDKYVVGDVVAVDGIGHFFRVYTGANNTLGVMRV